MRTASGYFDYSDDGSSDRRPEANTILHRVVGIGGTNAFADIEHGGSSDETECAGGDGVGVDADDGKLAEALTENTTFLNLSYKRSCEDDCYSPHLKVLLLFHGSKYLPVHPAGSVIVIVTVLFFIILVVPVAFIKVRILDVVQLPFLRVHNRTEIGGTPIARFGLDCFHLQQVLKCT